MPRYLLSKIGPGDALQVDLLEIQRAVERASSLTSQLLAFSRKQVISPKVMQVNDIIGNAQKMLGRIIGEDIESRVPRGRQPLVSCAPTPRRSIRSCSTWPPTRETRCPPAGG